MDLNEFRASLEKFLERHNLDESDNLISLSESVLADLSTDIEMQKVLCECLLTIPGTNDQIAFLRKLIASSSRAYQIFSLIGNYFFSVGASRRAVGYYAESCHLRPGYRLGLKRKGNALRVIGAIDAAVAAYREALQIAPDLSLRSRMLLSMHFEDSWTPAELAAEHFEWGNECKTTSEFEFSADSLDIDKVSLTIGYVSPDFKSHPVAYFLLPVLANHDPTGFRTICYATTRNNDGVTRRFQSLCHLWREAHGLSANEFAELIRNDGVDILVDVAGHTSGNRLDVFAQRAAPVQVTYLGYPNGTGLRTMDYRITDSISDPPQSADMLYREQLLRIDPVFLTFEPPNGSGEVAGAPCEKNGYVTFGSFNKFSKLSNRTISAWVQILEQVPTARLVLKAGGLEDPEEKSIAIDRFVAAGLRDRSRIQVMDLLPSRTEHLLTYGRIDMALDPFPYNGTTTTCQALWMGVPVLTLKGDNHVSRVGASILSQMGLTDLVGKTVDEYVQIAVDWANRPDDLAALRRRVRPQLLASALLDHKGFVCRLESTYRAIWRVRCGVTSP